MEIGVEGFKQRTEYTYTHSHHHRLRRAEIHVMNHNTRSLALQHTAHSLILKSVCVCGCVWVCGGGGEVCRVIVCVWLCVCLCVCVVFCFMEVYGTFVFVILWPF